MYQIQIVERDLTEYVLPTVFHDIAAARSVAVDIVGDRVRDVIVFDCFTLDPIAAC